MCESVPRQNLTVPSHQICGLDPQHTCGLHWAHVALTSSFEADHKAHFRDLDPSHLLELNSIKETNPKGCWFYCLYWLQPNVFLWNSYIQPTCCSSLRFSFSVCITERFMQSSFPNGSTPPRPFSIKSAKKCERIVRFYGMVGNTENCKIQDIQF